MAVITTNYYQRLMIWFEYIILYSTCLIYFLEPAAKPSTTRTWCWRWELCSLWWWTWGRGGECSQWTKRISSWRSWGSTVAGYCRPDNFRDMLRNDPSTATVTANAYGAGSFIRIDLEETTNETLRRVDGRSLETRCTLDFEGFTGHCFLGDFARVIMTVWVWGLFTWRGDLFGRAKYKIGLPDEGGEPTLRPLKDCPV